MSNKSVLFVCKGNICRSPAGEHILKAIAKERKLHPHLTIESRGLGSWHIGSPPDARMTKTAKKRGYDLGGAAELFRPQDYEDFDIILAADREVYETLITHAPTEVHKEKIVLMTAFSENYPQHDVPDPYYGKEEDFQLVVTMLEDACHGLLNKYYK